MKVFFIQQFNIIKIRIMYIFIQLDLFRIYVEPVIIRLEMFNSKNNNFILFFQLI